MHAWLHVTRSIKCAVNVYFIPYRFLKRLLRHFLIVRMQQKRDCTHFFFSKNISNTFMQTLKQSLYGWLTNK